LSIYSWLVEVTVALAALLTLLLTVVGVALVVIFPVPRF
jgi:hypothetical protein